MNVRLLSLLLATASLLQGETVWWEAESSPDTNMPVVADDPQALSGGKWLAGPVAEGLYATYPVTVADGGRYTFLIRRFWLHGALRWKFDDGPWVAAEGINQSVVDQVAGKPGPMAWTDLGYVTLAPGAHALRIETVPDSKFPFNKTYGLDCFVLSNDGFAPKGADHEGGPRLPDPKPDEAQFGKFLPRTMSLLESATPEHRTVVTILCYGQSIVGNSRIDVPLGKWLREKYPNAVIHIENTAIGGYEAPLLRRTCWQDLYPKNPDLVVFQDYGGEEHGELEEMFAGMRKNLVAEVLTWTPHVDNFGAGIDKQREATSQLVKDLGKKYDLEIVDLRTLWKENLKETHLDRQYFLVDQIHLNPKGIDFLFQSIIPHFRDNPAAPDAWRKKARTLALSADAPGVSFAPGSWSRTADGLVSTGTTPLKIAFSGNRLDLVGLPGAGSAKVVLDGKAPSALRDTLAAERSTLAPGAWWPALTRVVVADNAVPDEYTLHFHDVSPDGAAYAFDAVGAQTGPEGTGKAGADFAAASGRFTIATDDVALSRVMKTLKKPLPAQFDIVFKVSSMSKDAWTPPRQLANGHVGQETVVRCWTDGPHTVEIVPDAGAPVGVREAVVFSPSGLE